jgi:hypothetical protein
MYQAHLISQNAVLVYPPVMEEPVESVNLAF